LGISFFICNRCNNEGAKVYYIVAVAGKYCFTAFAQIASSHKKPNVILVWQMIWAMVILVVMVQKIK
jgi:hypothetical protein